MTCPAGTVIAVVQPYTEFAVFHRRAMLTALSPTGRWSVAVVKGSRPFRAADSERMIAVRKRLEWFRRGRGTGTVGQEPRRARPENVPLFLRCMVGGIGSGACADLTWFTGTDAGGGEIQGDCSCRVACRCNHSPPGETISGTGMTILRSVCSEPVDFYEHRGRCPTVPEELQPMPRTLVIVPCGQSKIWDRRPGAGPVPARDAYIGAPFTVNRTYAERYADAWVILSAKYGFLPPDQLLDGPYDVTFKKPGTNPIPLAALSEQARRADLLAFSHVIGLGGKEYRRAVQHVFGPSRSTLLFPTAGLRIGEAMRALNRAMIRGTLFPPPVM